MGRISPTAPRGGLPAQLLVKAGGQLNSSTDEALRGSSRGFFVLSQPPRARQEIRKVIGKLFVGIIHSGTSHCFDLLPTGPVALCETTEHCTSATGSACAQCLVGEYRCDGQDLMVCSDELSGFDFVKTCVDEQCSATAGDCSDFACAVDQRRCEGDELQVCNSARDGFDTLETCGSGLCDRVNFECDICVPDATDCATSTSLTVCDAEGQSEVEEACGMGTCSGPDGAAVCGCPTAPSGCEGVGTVCRSGDLGTCRLDANGCMEVSDEACTSPRTCTGSLPSAACTCPSVPECDSASERDGAYCSGLQTVVTCSADGAGCQEASSDSCSRVTGTERCGGDHPGARCEKEMEFSVATRVRDLARARRIHLVPISVSERLVLSRLGFIGDSLGEVHMAIYNDGPSGPSDLVAKTDLYYPTDGRNEIFTLTQPTLPEGRYWVGIMGEFDIDVDIREGSFLNAALLNVSGDWPIDWSNTWSGAVLSREVRSFYLVGLPE